jgi:competence protein ComEC
MSDLGMVGVAAGVWAGAVVARPTPVWPLAVAAGLFLAWRRPLLFGLAVALLASGLSAWAWAGVRPAHAGSFQGRATLVGDPDRLGGAAHAEVRAAGHHFDLWARGRAGAVLSQRAAGQAVEVRGRTTPRRPGDDWSARRHVVGGITAEELSAAGDGDPVTRLANAVRSTLLQGASVLPVDRRALFAGFVLGDDREQSISVADDFRGAGLTHLLVVSGENVAFVLAVAMPVLRRLGLRSRWLATLGLVGLFGAMTRFEPSVMRASAMAAVAVTAWMVGRPVTGLRTLALGVGAVVLVDPMLVGVLGFQLSVAASAGILVLAGPLSRHLPVPRRLAPALGVTLAAQVAVAPLLVARAGGMPVVAIPANLLAEPAAALIMSWGLTAGLVAGLAGPTVAGVLHRPTAVLLWWVATVARRATDLPLGRVALPSIVLGAAAVSTAVFASRRGQRGVAATAWLAALVVVAVLPGVAALGPAPPRTELSGVGTLWRAPEAPHDGVLVLTAGAEPADVLEQVRQAGVHHLDLVVAPNGGAAAEALVTVVRQRIAIDLVWVPAPRGGAAREPPGIAGEVRPSPGERFSGRGVTVEVTRARPTLDVAVDIR